MHIQSSCVQLVQQCIQISTRINSSMYIRTSFVCSTLHSAMVCWPIIQQTCVWKTSTHMENINTCVENINTCVENINTCVENINTCGKHEHVCGKHGHMCGKQHMCGKHQHMCGKHQHMCGKTSTHVENVNTCVENIKTCWKHQHMCGKHEHMCGKHQHVSGKHENQLMVVTEQIVRRHPGQELFLRAETKQFILSCIISVYNLRIYLILPIWMSKHKFILCR